MHQTSRQNSHNTASPRIKLIFFIFFLILLLTVAVVVYTHKSLDSINSASLYSAEIVALRKYHHNKQKQKELPIPTTSRPETKPPVPSRPTFDQKNCSSYIERFLLSDHISNSKESQNERRRTEVLDKWLHQPLFPPQALQLQLLTYKVRVVLKLHSGANARLWQPLIEETYDHILGLRHDKSLSIQSIDEKLRNFEYDVSFDENTRSGTALNEYQHKCFQEFPECSVWSRSKDIGMSLLLAERNNNNNSNNSFSLASQIRAFVNNKKKILDVKSIHVLNFVDILMNVKCCTEHRQLKQALRGVLQMARPKKIGEKNKISFSLTAGSLLAAVRENGYFIPWDTDVDLLIQPEDEEAVKKIIFGGSSSNQQNANKNASASSSSECCYAKLLDPPRVTDHGRLLGFVYPVPKNAKPFHEETSRVEIWVAQDDKKMQKKSVVLPLTRKCSLQEVGGDGLSLFCPNKIEKVLEGGYGEKWCVACKSKNSNCK